MAVILISYQELFELNVDYNFFKIKLKDWVDHSEKKEKNDYMKIINEYGDELA